MTVDIGGKGRKALTGKEQISACVLPAPGVLTYCGIHLAATRKDQKTALLQLLDHASSSRNPRHALMAPVRGIRSSESTQQHVIHVLGSQLIYTQSTTGRLYQTMLLLALRDGRETRRSFWPSMTRPEMSTHQKKKALFLYCRHRAACDSVRRCQTACRPMLKLLRRMPKSRLEASFYAQRREMAQNVLPVLTAIA